MISSSIRTAVLALAVAGLLGCEAMHEDERNPQRQAVQRRMPVSMRTARTAAPAADEYYLLAYFRDPDFNKVDRASGLSSEFGLYLATSRDGYAWEPANGDKPLFVPSVGSSRGMRDPCIARGPDGVFHLVWTWTAGDPRAIGYAKSSDLVTWTDVRSLRVMPQDVPVDYCWAPEIVWDPEATGPGAGGGGGSGGSGGAWVVSWSCAITGLNAETQGEAVHNHRMYYATTRDFRTFSPHQSLFDPGHPSIDPAWLRLPDEWVDRGLARPESVLIPPGATAVSESEPGRWLLFYKDERQWPEKKQIRMVRGASPRGPWGKPSAGLTIHWAEAPSALIIDDHVVVYYDEYREGRYGAIRSRDLLTWDDVQNLMSFPPLTRHGSVIRVTEPEWKRVRRGPNASDAGEPVPATRGQ